MTNETTKYEDALMQLETIVRKMEANEYDIDELAQQLKNAQQLIKFCKDKLTKTEADIRALSGDGQQ
jgi:exodeoxyribonuclease VII small subunit